ncbi:hypothetical protein EVAR_62932_1 [Eumeta japonica]|uniref:Uncharacterized protein n=1 Tax=Eumeta variegata TaxID=151549 RepID=A0A4C2AC43_EUMVA|nr:hypothetical protein EVAR_62932_1 [Eumeta japonica]
MLLNERTLTTEMVKSVGSCDQLDEVVETYTECIRQACDAAIPRKSSNTRGLKPLVESRVRGLKRDARKEAAHPKCGPGSGSTWSGRCRLGRVIRKQEKPGGCPIKTDSGQVIEANRRGSQPPEASGICRWTHLYRAEVRFALKAFLPQGPGIDGFTSDICQAAIFRDLGLFLAMANKCLELGYSPSLEGGGNQGDPEAGWKTTPVTYRPIGLLPVLGKTVKGCWSGASSGT